MSALRLTLITLPASKDEATCFPKAAGTVPELARFRPLAGALARADRVFCSPAASALAGEATPALRDRAYGLWAGRPIGAVATEDPAGFARWLDDPDFAPFGGESVAALVARARDWLDRLDADAGRFTAVTHPSFVRACLATVIDEPKAWFVFDIGHGSRTVLTRNGSRWRVVGVNTPLGP